jgi:hypothetical protein
MCKHIPIQSEERGAKKNSIELLYTSIELRFTVIRKQKLKQKDTYADWARWLMSTILGTWEVEFRRIMV